MTTGTGILGIFLAVGALVVSAANAKPAEAHVSANSLASAFTTPTTPLVNAPSKSVANAQPAALSASASVETITPPSILENPKLRRLQKAEVTPAMLLAAAQIVHKHYAKPVGTQVEVDVDGKHVVARIERHFHPEGGPVKPWGFHPGVSLFIAR